MQKQWLIQYWRQGIRAMSPRNEHEQHRASTPLELLFDLVTVIAIAATAGELHHAVAHGHTLEGAGKAHISSITATAVVTLPVALYLYGLWLVRDRFVFADSSRYLLLDFAVAVLPISLLAVGFGPIAGLLCITLCTLFAVLLRSSNACYQAHQLSVTGVE